MRLRDGLTLDKGTATLRADLTSIGGSERVELAASLDDLAATEGGRPLALREPARLSASVTRARRQGRGRDARGQGGRGGRDGPGRPRRRGQAPGDGRPRRARRPGPRPARPRRGRGVGPRPGRRPTTATSATTYKARFAADCKDLDLVRPGRRADPPRPRPARRLGLGPEGARRDAGRLAARPRFDLKSGDLKLDLAATHQDDGRSPSWPAVGLDVASPAPGRAEAKAAFVVKGRAFDVDELRAGLTPDRPDRRLGRRWPWRSGAGSTWPRARGRSRRSRARRSAPSAWRPEGLKVSGPGPARRAAPGRRGPARRPRRARPAARRLVGLAAEGAWAGPGGRASGSTRSAAGRLDSDGQIDVRRHRRPGAEAGRSRWRGRGATPPRRTGSRSPGSTWPRSYGLAALAGNLAEVKARRICDLNGDHRAPMGGDRPDPRRLGRARRPVPGDGPADPLEGSLQADSTAQLLTQQVARDRARPDRGPGLRRDAGAGGGGPPPGGRRGGVRPDPDHGQRRPGRRSGQPGLRRRLWPLAPARARHEDRGGGDQRRGLGAVLAFVAPVLAKATDVNGKVSVDIDRAALPITAAGSTAIDGAVVFQDVQFLPRPARARAGLDGRPARAEADAPAADAAAGGRRPGPAVAACRSRWPGPRRSTSTARSASTRPSTSGRRCRSRPGCWGSTRSSTRWSAGRGWRSRSGGRWPGPAIDRRAFRGRPPRRGEVGRRQGPGVRGRRAPRPGRRPEPPGGEPKGKPARGTPWDPRGAGPGDPRPEEALEIRAGRPGP